MTAPVTQAWKPRAKELLDLSPVLTLGNLELYSPRTPMGQRPTGSNHITDHQCKLQGIYLATIERLGFDTHLASEALRFHFKDAELKRGYKLEGGGFLYNNDEVSGEMATGFCFGFAHSDSEPLAWAMYDLALKVADRASLKTSGLESKDGIFRAGLNKSRQPIPLGIQDLAYLAILKAGYIASCRVNNPDIRLRWEFIKRFWFHGGFLSTLIPVAPIPFKRAYFNEINAAMSAHTLHTLSSSLVERVVFKLSLLMIWLMSFRYLNGFLSGMCRDAGLPISDAYMDRCLKYGMAASKYPFSMLKSEPIHSATHLPLEPYWYDMGELMCEQCQDYERVGEAYYRSTLGQLAQIAWSVRT